MVYDRDRGGVSFQYRGLVYRGFQYIHDQVLSNVILKSMHVDKITHVNSSSLVRM